LYFFGSTKYETDFETVQIYAISFIERKGRNDNLIISAFSFISLSKYSNFFVLFFYSLGRHSFVPIIFFNLTDMYKNK